MEPREQFFTRLMQPGVLLLAVGAVVTYASSFLAKMIFPKKEKANLVLKAVGGVIAIVGALMIFL